MFSVRRCAAAVIAVMSVMIPSLVVASDVPLTLTIPTSPFTQIIPPPAPTESKGGYRARGAMDIIDFGAKFWAQGQIRTAFQEATNSGLSAARKSGQQGVLLNVRYAENREPTGRWVPGGAVGDGVTVVGIGPNPGAICFISKCDVSVGVQLHPTAARRYTNESDYYWIGKKAHKNVEGIEYVIARFNRQELEAWTSQITLAKEASQAFARAINVKIVDDLAQKVKEAAKTKQASDEISQILINREKAKTELTRIETELAYELKRQAERAKTMETLKVMSWVLSAGEIANMEKISQKGASSSSPTLEEQLKAGNVRIEMLRERSAEWANKLEGTKTYLLDYTLQYSVPIPPMAPATVNPLPR
jgi:hypothetical protein